MARACMSVRVCAHGRIKRMSRSYVRVEEKNKAGYTVISRSLQAKKRKRHQRTDGLTPPLIESLRRD